MAEPRAFDVVLIDRDLSNPFNRRVFTVKPGTRAFLPKDDRDNLRGVGIGRSSKALSNRYYRMGEDNAWMDGPTISRRHAVLSVEQEPPNLTIMNVAATHGLFVDGKELETMQYQKLEGGEEIQLSIDIRRGDEMIAPRKFRIFINPESPPTPVSPNSDSQPKSFSVPEPSEDGSDSDEGSDLSISYESSDAEASDSEAVDADDIVHDSVLPEYASAQAYASDSEDVPSSPAPREEDDLQSVDLADPVLDEDLVEQMDDQGESDLDEPQEEKQDSHEKGPNEGISNEADHTADWAPAAFSDFSLARAQDTDYLPLQAQSSNQDSEPRSSMNTPLLTNNDMTADVVDALQGIKTSKAMSEADRVHAATATPPAFSEDHIPPMPLHSPLNERTGFGGPFHALPEHIGLREEGVANMRNGRPPNTSMSLERILDTSTTGPSFPSVGKSNFWRSEPPNTFKPADMDFSTDLTFGNTWGLYNPVNHYHEGPFASSRPLSGFAPPVEIRHSEKTRTRNAIFPSMTSAPGENGFKKPGISIQDIVDKNNADRATQEATSKKRKASENDDQALPSQEILKEKNLSDLEVGSKDDNAAAEALIPTSPQESTPFSAPPEVSPRPMKKLRIASPGLLSPTTGTILAGRPNRRSKLQRVKSALKTATVGAVVGGLAVFSALAFAPGPGY